MKVTDGYSLPAMQVRPCSCPGRAGPVALLRLGNLERACIAVLDKVTSWT